MQKNGAQLRGDVTRHFILFGILFSICIVLKAGGFFGWALLPGFFALVNLAFAISADVKLKRRAVYEADMEAERAAYEAETEAEVEAVFEAVDEITAAHLNTLVVKHRKLVYRDDYGRTISDNWVTELFYFYDNILLPELLSRGLSQDIATSLKVDVLTRIGELVYDAQAESDRQSRGEKSLDVLRLSPSEYEQYCASELQAAGWDARVTAGAGDQGVDIVATRGGIRAVFQCKLYSGSLGNKPVQEVHTGRRFHDADVAAVVSNAEFTPGARAAATQTGVILLHHSELPTFDFGSATGIVNSDETGGSHG